MRPLLKESFMFKVSKNAKISFFVKSKNLAVVHVTNAMSCDFFAKTAVGQCMVLKIYTCEGSDFSS